MRVSIPATTRSSPSLVNASLLIVAAATFMRAGQTQVVELEQAPQDHNATPEQQPGAANKLLAIALLCAR